jgi:hypothetical protein
MPRGDNQPNRWTDDRVRLLRQFQVAGMSASQIANAINLAEPGANVTRNAVIGKLVRIGTPTSKQAQLSKHAKQLMQAKRNPAAIPHPPRCKAPPERVPPPDPIPFSKRKPSQCAFIFGPALGPVNAHSPCCGQPIAQNEANRPYCKEHLKIVVDKHQGRRAA